MKAATPPEQIFRSMVACTWAKPLLALLKKPASAGFFVRHDKLCSRMRKLFNRFNFRASAPCWLPCALIACALLQPALTFAVQRCELNGKSVSPYNGSTTAGLSGIMRCKEDTGLMAREQELRGGVFMGLERFYDAKGKLQRERTVNERGNTEGVDKEFWPNGQLRSESNQINGKARGAARAFYESGKIERASFTLDGQVLSTLSWDKDGRLTTLECSQASVFAEDSKPCGFEGKVQTTRFFNGKRIELRTMEQGKILAATTFVNSTASASSLAVELVRSELAFQNGQRWHRTYNTDLAVSSKNVLRQERLYEPGRNTQGNELPLNSTSGRMQWSKAWGANEQLIEHVRYANGRPVDTERWYLNGAMKEKISVTHDSGGNQSVRELYDDAGRLTARQRSLAVGVRFGPDQEQLVGVQQSFHSNGKPAQEDTYSALDERGRTRLIARKQWDESGAVLADDDILEDGSRKRR